MKVSECMSRDVSIASPRQTIAEAARMMAECDSGVLPVGENDRLVGVITDRDIAIRAVAEKRGPGTPVRDIMTKEILYCFEDDDVDECAQNMGEQQVRRLPVVNRDKRLVGMISIGDIARGAESEAGQAFAAITRPGGRHDQVRH